jgi:hypothetical protein
MAKTDHNKSAHTKHICQLERKVTILKGKFYADKLLRDSRQLKKTMTLAINAMLKL